MWVYVVSHTEAYPFIIFFKGISWKIFFYSFPPPLKNPFFHNRLKKQHFSFSKLEKKIFSKVSFFPSKFLFYVAYSRPNGRTDWAQFFVDTHWWCYRLKKFYFFPRATPGPSSTFYYDYNYYYQNDRDANLSRFQGSTSISSDMYFNRWHH